MNLRIVLGTVLTSVSLQVLAQDKAAEKPAAPDKKSQVDGWIGVVPSYSAPDIETGGERQYVTEPNPAKRMVILTFTGQPGFHWAVRAMDVGGDLRIEGYSPGRFGVPLWQGIRCNGDGEAGKVFTDVFKECLDVVDKQGGKHDLGYDTRSTEQSQLTCLVYQGRDPNPKFVSIWRTKEYAGLAHEAAATLNSQADKLFSQLAMPKPVVK